MQCIAVCCSVLQCVAVSCKPHTLHFKPWMLNLFELLFSCRCAWYMYVMIDLQHTATHCNTLQHVICVCNDWSATHCNTLQHTATHCNTLQHVICVCNDWSIQCADFWRMSLIVSHRSLRLVGSFKLQVSSAEYSLFYRALVQKRPIFFASQYWSLISMHHTAPSHRRLFSSGWNFEKSGL